MAIVVLLRDLSRLNVADVPYLESILDMDSRYGTVEQGDNFVKGPKNYGVEEPAHMGEEEIIGVLRKYYEVNIQSPEVVPGMISLYKNILGYRIYGDPPPSSFWAGIHEWCRGCGISED